MLLARLFAIDTRLHGYSLPIRRTRSVLDWVEPFSDWNEQGRVSGGGHRIAHPDSGLAIGGAGGALGGGVHVTDVVRDGCRCPFVLLAECAVGAAGVPDACNPRRCGHGKLPVCVGRVGSHCGFRSGAENHDWCFGDSIRGLFCGEEMDSSASPCFGTQLGKGLDF